MGADDVSFVLQLVVIGLCAGALYALVALGYTLIYGVLGTINFSHGEICLFGGYAGYVAVSQLGVSIYEAVLVGAAAAGALVLFLERVLFRRLTASQRLSLLVGHIGVSVAIRSVLSLRFGEGVRSLDSRPDAEEALSFAGVAVSPEQVSVVVAAGGLALLLWLVLFRTRLGRSLRALSQDREAAAVKGVAVLSATAAAYGIGGLFGGAAGVLSAQLTDLTPQVGILLGIKAFTACVIGGIGRIQGAVFGGLLVGLFESFTTGVFGDRYGDAFMFALLAITLIVFPGGLISQGSLRASRAPWN